MGTLMDLPLSMPVVAAWGVWLAAGLVLIVWSRRAREAMMFAEAPRSAARHIPARPKSGVRSAKPAPAPADAFGELQTLLDPPHSAARRPVD